MQHEATERNTYQAPNIPAVKQDLDILAQVGEERFIQVLYSISLDIRDNVLGMLAYGTGWDEEVSDWITFQEKYPRLAMIVSNHMAPTE